MNLRWKFLDRWHDAGLLILRGGVGTVFLGIHGVPLLSEGGSGWSNIGRAVSYLGIHTGYIWWGFAAMLAMTVGAACLILGLFHRVAALVLTITMIVAAIWRFYPFGGFEAAAYPICMAIVCLSLFIIGPGRYSLESP